MVAITNLFCQDQAPTFKLQKNSSVASFLNVEALSFFGIGAWN
jgi:hypothetical protein